MLIPSIVSICWLSEWLLAGSTCPEAATTRQPSCQVVVISNSPGGEPRRGVLIVHPTLSLGVLASRGA
jgi:hypothetical protein